MQPEACQRQYIYRAGWRGGQVKIAYSVFIHSLARATVLMLKQNKTILNCPEYPVCELEAVLFV
jgi:hypothetical protein